MEYKQATSRLGAKVLARNTVNATALELVPGMRAALAPFVGKTITNQGEDLCAKVRAALPTTEATVTLHFWYSTSAYSLGVNFKTSVGITGDCGCFYAESYATLGEIENHILVSVPDKLPSLRTDYTETEVISARASLRAAQDALSTAQSNLSGFGEHDW